MKMKAVVLFVVAIGSGLVAMLGVQKSLSRDKGPKKEESVKVLVATAEIEPGIGLDMSNTSFKSMPKSAVPEGAITKLEDIDNKSLRSRAFPGDLILEAKLKVGFGVDIPPGMRVTTIPVDATKTHSGLLLPGNQVDIILSYKARKPGQTGSSNHTYQKTKTVLENIKVFATDNRREAGKSEAGENAAKTVSLLVTPQQANLLALAESKGKLHLSLRRTDDATSADGDDYAVDEDKFEGLTVSSGVDGEEGGEDGDVRKYLEKEKAKEPEPQPVAATPEPEVPVEPERPKWKISIHSGAEVRVEEVELPLENDKTSMTTEPAADDQQEPTLRRTGSAIKDYLVKFFAGA